MNELTDQVTCPDSLCHSFLENDLSFSGLAEAGDLGGFLGQGLVVEFVGAG